MGIRRFPPAYEQATWPDTLPATMVVPAGHTLYVPGDLDLSDSDLTVHGTVMMPAVPVALAAPVSPLLWNGATVTEIAAGGQDVTIEVQLTLDDVPLTERCAFMCGLITESYETFTASMDWTAGAGTAIVFYDGNNRVPVMVVTDATGFIELNIDGGLELNTPVLLAIISPSGRVITNPVLLRGFSPA